MAPRGTRRTIAAGAALLAAAASLASASAARAATTITVPAMQPTIQAAIAAASNGDTVLVSPGTYNENIDFQGKAITVESSQGAAATTINGGAAGPVARFATNETRSSILQGFTLRNGMTTAADGYDGGGVYIYGASPSILNNVIVDNFGCNGTGVAVDFSSALIQGNTITGNDETTCSGGMGGGVLIGGAASAQLIGNTISVNRSDSGGGVALYAAGTPTLLNNVVENNVANIEGGGFYVVNHSDAALVQDVIAGNTSPSAAGMDILTPSGTRGPWFTNDTISGNGVFVSGYDTNMVVANTLFIAPAGSLAVQCDTTYNSGAPAFVTDDLYNGGGTAFSGPCLAGNSSSGNVSVDPLFVNASSGNYHLSSGSPVINVGTNSASGLPSTDLDGNPRIVGGTVDLGVYEFQTPITVPGAVTNLVAVRNRSTITVSWSPPASNGGSAITGYRVTQSPGATQTLGAGVLSVTYVNTSRRTSYTFTVAAINTVGVGPATSVTVPRA